MSALHDYASYHIAEFQLGVEDNVRAGLADVQSTYLELLTADATVGPPEARTGTMETVTFEAERDYGLPVLESDPVQDIAAAEMQAEVDAPAIDTAPDVDMGR